MNKLNSMLLFISLMLFVGVAAADPFFGFGWGYGIIGLVLMIFVIIAVIEVLQSSRPVEEKLLWVIILLVVPLIGLIVYYLIGKK